MTKMREISLGNGQKVKVTYTELKTRRETAIPQKGVSRLELLKRIFPDEYAREFAAREEVAAKSRWDRWFSAQNSESNRRRVMLPVEQSYLAEGGDLYADNGHRHLLNRAMRAAELPYRGTGRNRITDFSSWIFYLDHPPHARAQAEGHWGEREIKKIKKLNQSPKLYDSNWQLLFEDDYSDTQTALRASILQVNGTPISRNSWRPLVAA